MFLAEKGSLLGLFARIHRCTVNVYKSIGYAHPLFVVSTEIQYNIVFVCG